MKTINLIGISGYIGSGKDTVAEIIRWLTSNHKDRPDLNLSELALKYYHHQPSILDTRATWEIKKFAGKLKQMVSLLTGIPVEDLEKLEVKNSELGDEWGILNGWADYPENESKTPMTVRQLLQKLGTDAVRNKVHQNAWVNALFADYKGYTPKVHSGIFSDLDCYIHAKCTNCGNKFYGYKRQLICKECVEKEAPYYPNWLISDTRFPNEAQAIKDRGGIVIRVNRYNSQDGSVYGWGKALHSSETSLDNWNFDYTINNGGTIENLIEEVRKMLEHFKVI